jgi:hypothetical protein
MKRLDRTVLEAANRIEILISSCGPWRALGDKNNAARREIPQNRCSAGVGCGFILLCVVARCPNRAFGPGPVLCRNGPPIVAMGIEGVGI